MLTLLLAACRDDDPKPTGPDPTDATPPTTDTAPPTGPTGDTGTPPETGDTGAPPVPSLCTLPSGQRIAATTGEGFATPAIGPDRAGDGCGDLWFSAPASQTWHVSEGQPIDLAQPTYTGTWFGPTPTAAGVWVATLLGPATYWVTTVPSAPPVPTDPASVAAGSLEGIAGDALLPIGDLDGDGLEDVIAADTTDQHGVGWWTAPFDRAQTRDDALGFWTGIDHRSGLASARLHSVPDVTGDGLPELLVGALYAEHVYLLSGPVRATAPLDEVALAWAETPHDAIESHVGSGLGTGDLDGDGALEWAAADEFAGELYLVPGTWVGQVDLATVPIGSPGRRPA